MNVNTVLGFDYGEQRIGVAVGQTITASATPLVTLNAIKQKPDWLKIEALINEWQPDLLIVGIPYYLDGRPSEMTLKAERFSRQLEGRFNLPVNNVNETLSSFEAEQEIQKKMKINQHNKQEIDKMSAAIIVQSWLEHNQ
ncbi:MAG: Holliday junction resolvase RuvX [Gammaproteobacteria bacterium]|nr:Holliday junction resolvase RuvX [Gammaproteobacteria bacterium]